MGAVVHNLIAFGKRWDIEAVGRTGYVRLAGDGGPVAAAR